MTRSWCQETASYGCVGCEGREYFPLQQHLMAAKRSFSVIEATSQYLSRDLCIARQYSSRRVRLLSCQVWWPCQLYTWPFGVGKQRAGSQFESILGRSSLILVGAAATMGQGVASTAAFRAAATAAAAAGACTWICISGCLVRASAKAARSWDCHWQSAFKHLKTGIVAVYCGIFFQHK